jgi:hypothetical protein
MKNRLAFLVIAGVALFLFVPAYSGLRAPAETINMPVNQWLRVGTYPDEIGSIAIMTERNIMRVDDVYACDPLSNYGLLIDTTGKPGELHFVHDQYEQEQEYIWKVNVGSQRIGVPTIEFIAQSFTTRTQQQLFQFGADGKIWFCGQPSDIDYPDILLDHDCPYTASALEIKVRMYPQSQVCTFQVINRGITSGFNKLVGPYPLIPEIAAQGIDRCIVKARPDSGINYIDGVICKGNSLALPPPLIDGKVITKR